MYRINLPKSLSSIPFIAYVMTIDEYATRYRDCTEFQRIFNANNVNTTEMAEQIDKDGDKLVNILSAGNVKGDMIKGDGHHRAVAITDRSAEFIVIEYQLKSIERHEIIMGEINNFDNPKTSWKLRHNPKFVPAFNKLSGIKITVKESKQHQTKVIDYSDLLKCVISAVAQKRPAGISGIKKEWTANIDKINDTLLTGLVGFMNMYKALTEESLDKNGQINCLSGVALAAWCRFFQFRNKFNAGAMVLFFSKNQKIILKQLDKMDKRDTNSYAFWSYIFSFGFEGCEDIACISAKRLNRMGNDFPMKVVYNG